MYKLGRRPHHSAKRAVIVIAIIVGLILASVFAFRQLFKAETILGTSDGSFRQIEVAAPPTKRINERTFMLDIPKTWQATESKRIPAAHYAWRGTTKADSSRLLEIYINDIPTDMAVNRLLPLKPNGKQVVISDSVSDNCVNFTDAEQADRRTATIKAKWSGVDFVCDTGNYLRNVVGTGSAGTINSISLTGPHAGTHRFFFVYTDHGAEADYEVFTDILESFKVR